MNLMSRMSQEEMEKNNLRFKTKLQMSRCVRRLRHRRMEASSSRRLLRNIAADAQLPGREGGRDGGVSLFVVLRWVQTFLRAGRQG